MQILEHLQKRKKWIFLARSMHMLQNFCKKNLKTVKILNKFPISKNAWKICCDCTEIAILEPGGFTQEKSLILFQSNNLRFRFCSSLLDIVRLFSTLLDFFRLYRTLLDFLWIYRELAQESWTTTTIGYHWIVSVKSPFKSWSLWKLWRKSLWKLKKIVSKILKLGLISYDSLDLISRWS